MSWAKIAVLCAVLTGASFGCYTTKNHGKGDCKQYRPWCLKGHTVCTHDNRGCEVCSCEQHGAAGHKLEDDYGKYH